MENLDLQPEIFLNGHQFNTLTDKITSNLDGVSSPFTDFKKEAYTASRLRVNIDWSNGTIILESNRN